MRNLLKKVFNHLSLYEITNIAFVMAVVFMGYLFFQLVSLNDLWAFLKVTLTFVAVGIATIILFAVIESCVNTVYNWTYFREIQAEPTESDPPGYRPNSKQQRMR